MEATQEQRLFKALAEPLRRRLLCLLAAQLHCVGDLVTILEVPQPTVSRHLAQLRRAGLVTANQRGLWIFYSITEPASPLHERLLVCLELAARTTAEHLDDTRRARALQAHGGCCPYDGPGQPEHGDPGATACRADPSQTIATRESRAQPPSKN